MERFVFNPKTLGEPVGYFSRAVRIGDTLHVSGTSAITGFTGDLNDRRIPSGIEEQTRLTLDNIKKVLADAGAKMADVFEVFVMFKRKEDFPQIDAIFREYFPEPSFIATGFQTELVREDMLVEVAVRAHVA